MQQASYEITKNEDIDKVKNLVKQKAWEELNKLDLKRVDPNTKCEDEYFGTGISLALLLTLHRQLNLLSKLDLSKADLNAKPVHDCYPDKDISLTLILASKNQWRLLKKLIEVQRIDLNTLQSIDKKLLPLLIDNNQKEILKIIYMRENSLAKKITINDDNLALLDSILLTLMDDKSIELTLNDFLTQYYDKNEIATLITTFQSNKNITNYLNYYLAKKYAELVNQKNNIQENTENINEALNCINTIKDTMFYAKAKECESHMLNSILENEDDEKVLDEFAIHSCK